jgi:hypothetical protein
MQDLKKNKNLKSKDSKVSAKSTKINNMSREIEETLSVSNHYHSVIVISSNKSNSIIKRVRKVRNSHQFKHTKYLHKYP